MPSPTREGWITTRLSRDRVEIIDTRVGVPEDRLPYIFYRQVKGKDSRGTGLGLSIVARTADMLRWQLDISSRSGLGTHVTLRFGDSIRHGVAGRASYFGVLLSAAAIADHRLRRLRSARSG